MHFLKLLRIPLFLIKKKKKKKRYTSKQHTHFSMAPSRPKKSFSKNHLSSNSGCLKKMTPKSQAKIKPPFPQYLFRNYFEP